MPRGCQKGENRGQGRKPGVKNKDKAALEAKVAETGMTPLEIMLGAARSFWDTAQAEPDADKKRALIALASDKASQAAPYCHRKMPQAIDGGDDGKPVKHEHGLTPELMKLVALDVAKRLGADE